MSTILIADERIKTLQEAPVRPDGRYVLYWMQRAQRAADNHALEYAVQQANEYGVPVVVLFALTGYPEANERHYTFMLEGLQETAAALARRDILMVVRIGRPPAVVAEWEPEAVLTVCDRAYLRLPRRWRLDVVHRADGRIMQVETDVVVPIDTVTDKREYAARTIRPKIHKHLDRFMVDLRTTAVDHGSADWDADGVDMSDIAAVLDALDVDRSVPAVSNLYKGGTSMAKTTLRTFLDRKFAKYDDHRNKPQTNNVSHMSKYLHFGQISPVYVAMRIRETGRNDENVDSYIEELIVRRELAVNFAAFTPDYDSFETLPNWALTTLREHAADEREHLYGREELIQADTHDPYWNAAMKEMRDTGYMHNYMRMYWGKKILEWSPSPQDAFETALYLNNRFFIDGRDANSYTGVAWVFGLHDRAWKERPVYGKTRYMSASGLKRKADPDAYIQKVDRLAAEAAG